MRVRRVELSNVKSFRDHAVIELDPKLNIFIGPNAGGKSNLLDILTIALRKYLVQGYYVSSGGDNQVRFSDLNFSTVFEPAVRYLEPFRGGSGQPRISLTLEVTDGDIENIHAVNDRRADLESAHRTYRSAPSLDLDMLTQWTELRSGTALTYSVENGNLNAVTDRPAQLYLQYLRQFNMLSILAEALQGIRLTSLFLYFPPHRGVTREGMGASLSGTSFNQAVSTYQGVSSKTPASLLSLATVYFGEKRREMEATAADQGWRTLWNNDEEVVAVSSRLSELGYSWNLHLTNRNQNTYEIELSSNGRSYGIDQASSGEAEFLNFLLGLHSVNARHGLVVVDEPELHLHPGWQSRLRDLFMELADDLGDQFILATHSPSFINADTILNTIRVYREKDGSSRTAVFSGNLGTAKDLLHIVKTGNNERMFFADKVVLVEGDVDTIILRKMVSVFTARSQFVVEVLGVGGRTMLMKYREFLNANSILNAIIADLDYIVEVGNDSVKTLLGTAVKRLERALKDKRSQDGTALVEAVERAIATKSCNELKAVWDYLKSRHVKIREDLTPDENARLESAVADLVARQVFLLAEGEIEDYLPEGFEGVADAVEIVKDTNFVNWLKDDSQSGRRDPLERVVFKALDIDYGTRERLVAKYASSVSS